MDRAQAYPAVSAQQLGVWIAALAVVASLAGCVVFTPVTTTAYNPECATIERHMKLQANQINVLVGCQNEGCIQALALAGVVSATTLVVSGSVALVGDIVYWLEARGKCREAQSADSPR